MLKILSCSNGIFGALGCIVAALFAAKAGEVEMILGELLVLEKEEEEEEEPPRSDAIEFDLDDGIRAMASRLAISCCMEPFAEGSRNCWNHFCSSTRSSTVELALTEALRGSFFIKARSPK